MQKEASTLNYDLHPLGDNAIIIELGVDIKSEIHDKVQLVTSILDSLQEEWMIEYIPAFTTVTIFYDPVKVSVLSAGRLLPYDWACSELKQLLKGTHSGRFSPPRVIEIPVCYGVDFGPDLQFVAEHNGLTTEEVIHIHSSGDYLVYMIGFSPGFPYIGGMSERIATPRRESPRMKIPPRTVGIAGKQTGIYPIGTPGGWQLIGRTPLALFRPSDKVPSLLKAGDKIKFKPISLEEYTKWEEDNR